MRDGGIPPRQRLRLGALTETYRSRHGAAVEWLKAAVGAGQEYVNPVARAVLSERGGWVECIDLPMEFSGAVGGPAPYRLVEPDEAMRITQALYNRCAPPPARKTCALLALYTPGGIADGRHVYASRANPAHDVGEYRPGVVPLYTRCRMTVPHAVEGMPAERGVVFLMALNEGRHLVGMLPHGEAGLGDLGGSGRQVEQ